MTGLDLDRLGLHPIGHKALQLRRDHPVFPVEMAYQLGLDRLAACVVFPRDSVRDASLHGVEDACLGGRDIAAKSLRNASSLNCTKPPDLTRPALAGGAGNLAASAG
jgi:hypothetical protein